MPDETDTTAKRAAWLGLVFLALGIVGIIAHGINDLLLKAFHLQPNVFFAAIAVFGFAIWYPVGARSSLAIVADSARAFLWSWRNPPSPPPPAGD